MIEKSRYIGSVVVANNNANLNLAPVASSPLAALFDASTASNPFYNEGNNVQLQDMFTTAPVHQASQGVSVGYLSDSIQFATSSYGETVSPHSAILAELAEDFAKIVASHLNMAQNVVAPRASAFIEDMQQYLKNMTPPSPEASFKIEKCEVPELFSDSAFFEMMLKKYMTAPHHDDIEFAGIAAKLVQSPEFYGQLMNLGSDRLNGLVQKWLGNMPEDFVKYVFYKIFCTDFTTEVNETSDLIERYDAQYRINNYSRLNMAVASLIIAENLKQNPIVTDLSSSDYQEKLVKVTDSAGAVAVACLKAITAQTTSKVMVTEANMNSKTVYVNATNYREWLTNGGSPEMLFGMLVSGRVQYTAAAVDEIKQELLEHWNNYVAITEKGNRATMVRTFETYMRSAAVTTLFDLSDIEKEYMEKNPGYVDEVTRRIDTEMIKHSGSVVERLNHVALELMTKCRFFFTSAYVILNGMQKAHDHNPDIDPREAAFLATADYIADFLATMVTEVQ